MKENFPNSVKKIDMQVQEAQRVLSKTDAKRPTPKYIKIKMSKFKDRERISKAAREKKFIFSFFSFLFSFLHLKSSSHKTAR